MDNQIEQIISRIVRQEVLVGAGEMIQKLNEDAVAAIQDGREPLVDLEELRMCMIAYDRPDEDDDDLDFIEAASWYIVSDWLADKLEQEGALVSRDILGFNVWGRTDGGQSLELNHELASIAEKIASR